VRRRPLETHANQPPARVARAARRHENAPKPSPTLRARSHIPLVPPRRLKNLLDACCGALSWYFIGYGFAYPGTDTGNAFIGLTGSAFALGNIDDTVEGYASTTSGTAWISWYFQFAFAAAAATIVSGAVAERCALSAYLIYTLFITGFIYPVVVHWVWDSNGWLSAWNSKPVGGPILPCIDFAGSGVVRAPHPFFPSRRRPFF